MKRVLEPELLDSLPADHPDARRSRLDLRRINRLMGNYRWIVRTLTALRRPGERWLEIGAGDGTLGRLLAARGLPVDGLDFGPRPPDWPVDRAWHSCDLRTFDGYGNYDGLIANLVLHHLSDAELAALGARWRRGPRLVCASEPERRRRNQTFFSAVAPILRAHAVTRHDGRVSIAAGFRAGELSQTLGLHPAEWATRDRESAWGACRLVALRDRQAAGQPLAPMAWPASI